MAFNGSGTFLRLYNWVNDKAANIKVRADRMDAEMDGMATGLSTCITKNGQTTVTANLPMANFRHTGVGNASARTDYAAAGQVQDGKLNWVAAGGTADAITATYSPAITALDDGQICYVRAGFANATTTPTFAPNGLTARTITKNGNQALVAGDISGSGHELILRYRLSDTKWELMNPSYSGIISTYLPLSGGTLTGDTNITKSGAVSFYVQQTGNASMYLQSIGSAGLVGTGTNHPVGLAVNGSIRCTVTTGGQFVVGSASATTGCILEAVSTSGAFAPPRMTTVQKNAISSPSAGMMVYDNTLSALSLYTSSWQALRLASTSSTTYQASPSDPIGTTNTTGVMMGLAGSITPTATGKILILISGNMANSLAGANQCRAQIRYGTGSAPANGGALTGTAVGGAVVTHSSNNAYQAAFSLNAIVSGLTLSTAHWIDISLAAISGGTASATNISISVVEV